MITRIRFLLILFFGSFFMQAQISLKKNDSELKQINSAVTEQKAVTDQVILDDLIVAGSACIGQDCANGESFGFDTIRLKENNLRIKAQDTSTSASFPTNDWQITFNDSANGGQNKFSIDDVDGGRTPFTIEASAPSHSLYVDNSGRLGLGTNNPVVDIHVKSGNTPTNRFEQDGTSGFGAQIWDVAGNEANFFIRDASNGSTLPFRLFPGAPSNAITIEASTGDVGLGTTSPDARLDIEDADPRIRFTKTGDSPFQFEIGNATTGFSVFDVSNSKTPLFVANNALDSALIINDLGIRIKGGFLTFPDGSTQNTASSVTGGNGAFTTLNTTGNGYFGGDLFVKGNVSPGSLFSPSDFRLKGDINEIGDATRVVSELLPKSFFFKKEYIDELGLSSSKQFGFIAQDIEKVMPDLVKELTSPSGMTYKSVNYNALIPVLVQALKEQKLRIDELESEVADYASLESRLNSIEAQLSSKSKNAKR
jgi:hypothetical protein